MGITIVAFTNTNLSRFPPITELERWWSVEQAYFRAFATSLQAVADNHGDTSYAREIRWLAELCRYLDGAVTTILTTWETAVKKVK